MRTLKRHIMYGLVLLSAASVFAEEYTAYSLKTAQQRITAGESNDRIRRMAGITHLAAAVRDETSDDIILVGKKVPDQPPVSLDDWAVAVRAVLTHRRDPAVSIDRTAETDKTHRQQVHFEGGLEDTAFGRDLLAADVVLKRLGLAHLTADIFGLRSYLDYSVQDFADSGRQNPVISRFWFVPDRDRSRVTAMNGLIVAEDYAIRVSNQIMSSDGSEARDIPGELFAQDLYARFGDVKLYFPELARMEQLYYVTAVAQGLEPGGMSDSATLAYWLGDYPVRACATRREFPVEKTSANAAYGDKNVTIHVSGGVDLSSLVYRMQSGGIDEIKEYVLAARPNEDALAWEVPLFGCVLDDHYDPTDLQALTEAEQERPAFGTSFFKEFRPAQAVYRPPAFSGSPISYQPLSSPPVSMRAANYLDRPRYTPDVGGIMLENTARITGDTAAGPLDMAGAGFSFILDGDAAQLDPHTFRKFITALWAVYYSQEDPGISIDPIAPGAAKHRVRYIGQVINTDLGRVMREADYLMKQWAVGTETPDIEGFQSPLEYAADAGMLSVGAWSRFWFVPQDMQFRRAENALLFEGGRMTVQTEYMFQGFGGGADPANQQFAAFFTEHYEEIAQKYPVFQELYDYAKMVSLAKYLKESGVPLFWFIMANKDQVLTEDSVSTVDALVKNSQRFEGIQVEGGVELCSRGRYIYDEAAIEALQSARADRLSPAQECTETAAVFQRPLSEPVSFTVQERRLTAAPQHSASAGIDYRGLRYQTDFAVRDAGYQLTPDKCSQLQDDIFRFKYAALLNEAADADGQLPPDSAERLIEDCWNRARAQSRQMVRNLEPLIHRETGSRTQFLVELKKMMTPDDYASWSGAIADYAFYNTCLELVRYLDPARKTDGDFGPGWNMMIPYRIQVCADQHTEFQGLVLPEKIALVDNLSANEEILIFDPNRFQAAAYVPEDVKKSQVVGVFVMSDGTLRMLDKIENEFEFNGAGYLTDMIFSDRHMIHLEYQTDYTAVVDAPPYRIERTQSPWVNYQAVRLPERLAVNNPADGTSQEVVFTDRRAIIGYEPVDPNSPVQFVALMTDLSYRLLDRDGNELLFDAAGTFREMVSPSEDCLVASISSGDYSVRFEYTRGPQKDPVIARATLHKEGRPHDDIVMHYAYGTNGFLAQAQVRRPAADAL